MNITVTFHNGEGAGSGRVRVGHNSGVQNPDAVWTFTLNEPSSDLTFNLSWDNDAAGTGWRGEYEYVFALSTNGTANKQLAKGSTNIEQVFQKLSGVKGSTVVKFTKTLNSGVYYLRANFNGTKLSTMKAFSTTVTGSANGEEGAIGGGGVPARKIYIEKSIKKADDDNTVDRMIMVGYGGFLTRTTNGTSWSSVTTGTSNALYSIQSVGGKFLAVGDNGQLVKSEDSGATWTRQTISTVAFESATYSNGLWVVAGGNEIWVSTDFSTWEKTLDITIQDTTHFEGVMWDGEKFIAYGVMGCNYISNDGYSWDRHQINWTYPSYFIKMIKAQGYIYAIRFDAGGSIYRSKDGYIWTRVRSVNNTLLVNITYGNGRLLATGQNGLISYSDDGLNWTDYTYQSDTMWNAVGYGFGEFVIGGTTGSVNRRALSTDGVNWTNLVTLSKSPTDVAFGLSQYHYDIRQACLEELQKRNVISKVEGEVENRLPPKYGEDYSLGDIVEVNAAGWQGRQRITKVRHVLEPNRVSITPVIGDDFLDLRQFIAREVDK